MVKIDLISAAGCKKCERARAELKTIAEDMIHDRLVWRDLNVLDELDYAVELGVLTLPAMAINGTLTFTNLPSADQLRTELAKHIA